MRPLDIIYFLSNSIDKISPFPMNLIELGIGNELPIKQNYVFDYMYTEDEHYRKGLFLLAFDKTDKTSFNLPKIQYFTLGIGKKEEGLIYYNIDFLINYNVPNSQDHLNKHSYFTKL